MSDQVQGVGYSLSEVEMDATTLKLETEVTALELEVDMAALELEVDMAALELETETDVSQEILKQEQYSAD
jgi:hypothetical protein